MGPQHQTMVHDLPPSSPQGARSSQTGPWIRKGCKWKAKEGGNGASIPTEAEGVKMLSPL